MSFTPLWLWLVAGLGFVAIGVASIPYRRNRAQEQTVRRQVAREVALKARFDDLFDRSSELMIVHDRRGRVTTINRSGEQITGYRREELRLLDPGWIFGTGYLDQVMAMIAEGPDSAPRTFRAEFVPRKGTPVPVDAHVRVVVGDGQVVVMPRMNGAELARAADRIRPGLKILFISGHPERAGAGLDPTGVTNLLMKPFTADTLAARIKEIISGRKEADGWTV